MDTSGEPNVEGDRRRRNARLLPSWFFRTLDLQGDSRAVGPQTGIPEGASRDSCDRSRREAFGKLEAENIWGMSPDARTREMLAGLNRAQRLDRRSWRNSTAWCATPLPVRRFAESRGNHRERVSLTLWFPHTRRLRHFRYHFLIASDITSIPGARRQQRSGQM